MTICSKPIRLVLFGVASAYAILTGTAATAAEPPNLLFIITDQQFADVMSCRMGREHIHTPSMDSLATQGMLFTRAYSSNPICMPWRASAFTGLYSHQTGVTRNGACGYFREMQPKSMAHYFKNAGYETAYNGKWQRSQQGESSREYRQPQGGVHHLSCMSATARRHVRDDAHGRPATAARC